MVNRSKSLLYLKSDMEKFFIAFDPASVLKMGYCLVYRFINFVLRREE